MSFAVRELLTTDKEKRELSPLVSRGEWIDPKAWFSRLEANKYLQRDEARIVYLKRDEARIVNATSAGYDPGAAQRRGR